MSDLSRYSECEIRMSRGYDQCSSIIYSEDERLIYFRLCQTVFEEQIYNEGSYYSQEVKVHGNYLYSLTDDSLVRIDDPIEL